MVKEVSVNQIIRFDGRNVFIEVMDSAFKIGKVVMNFKEYDLSKPQGQRFTKEVTIYMDIDEFETLAHDIKFRYIDKVANNARQQQKLGGYKYCKEIYVDIGGTTKENLAKRDKAREDNKDESRQFKITPGDKMPWILSAEKGAGKRVEETGLIAPDGKPDVIIRVPLSDKDFRKFAIIVDNEIQAWRASKRVLAETQETIGIMQNMINKIGAMVEKIGIRLFRAS